MLGYLILSPHPRKGRSGRPGSLYYLVAEKRLFRHFGFGTDWGRCSDAYDTQRPAMRANSGCASALTSGSQPTGNLEPEAFWRGASVWLGRCGAFVCILKAGDQRSPFRVRFTVSPDGSIPDRAVNPDIPRPVISESVAKATINPRPRWRDPRNTRRYEWDCDVSTSMAWPS
jgi:hypothetical protein